MSRNVHRDDATIQVFDTGRNPKLFRISERNPGFPAAGSGLALDIAREHPLGRTTRSQPAEASRQAGTGRHISFFVASWERLSSRRRMLSLFLGK
ncbi:hypothetical protein [Paenibacillus dendritiformis]|uniref:Uncharacterized protein n=1 Tax=Paenibacillus dendritiformis C454 TaxID=1131935 RepID=H3SG97_9BACL|nr:hypothetical protein [Paenibacillus dendritiformis]EHQ61907.1 hypothetical protein PDENDC454_12760 [Paenibacillus dendritiformis C454]CAH8767570.1 hypothetical protein H7S4_000240 [Paenibacillus dendritiformis]